MSEIEFFIVLIIAIIIAIIAMKITWEVSDYFIAPKDYFYKSSYKILLKKLGMCTGIGIITIFLTFKIYDLISPNETIVKDSSNDQKNIKKKEIDKILNKVNSTKPKSKIKKSESIEIDKEFEESKGIDKKTKEPVETIDKIIDNVEPTITQNQKGDIQIATEMLKDNNSVKEISESTSLSKKEIRILKRKLRKEN